MKKVIIYIVVILIALFLINFTRNFILLSNLENCAKNTNLNNVYIKKIYKIYGTESIGITEIFKKDNIVLVKNYEDNQLSGGYWKDFSSNEEKFLNLEEKENNFTETPLEINSIIGEIVFEPFPLKYKILFSASHIVKVKSGIITLSDSDVVFSYNKNTGILVEHVINHAGQPMTTYYEVEIDNVKEEDITISEV